MFDRVEFGYESENYGQDQFKVIGKIFESYSQETALLDMAAACPTISR
jgi:carboxymethylenebutenolidase